jgi:hypothetical protein
MQAEIEKVCCYVFTVRPFSCGIRNDQRDIVSAQEFYEGFIKEAVVAYFDGIP